ncbi:diguanylate cyclase domain-containing protein [Paraburkholderia tropica]|uniref:diguanylate cyclase domain-containing protein n=1 Tax=Paraburkholderia tropica TaxID=92647 RepID=UPI002AB74EC5|nr:diguanylate cyclase [Paraburkholderia tropica]
MSRARYEPEKGHTPIPLAKALRRAHVLSVAVVVIVSNVLLMSGGLIELRHIAIENMSLTASSIAYTLEAAVVFHDRAAAMDIVKRIATANAVETVDVLDGNGAPFVSWRDATDAAGAAPLPIFASFYHALGPSQITVPVVSGQQKVGEVRLRGRPDREVAFILSSAAWILLCVAVSIPGMLALSHRMFKAIVEPLGNLANVTRQVRLVRAWNQRVPRSRLTEINDLATDFNALLEELQVWEARMQTEQATLSHRAAHDSLTGLPNRSFFTERFEVLLQGAAATHGRLAVLYVDCNDFKVINDEYGHDAGDDVLKALASRMRSSVRANDMVARLGGDEFVIVLSPITDVQEPQQIALSIAQAMADPIHLGNARTVTASVSVGIAVYPEDGLDSAGLTRAADRAMYEMKQRKPTRQLGATSHSEGQDDQREDPPTASHTGSKAGAQADQTASIPPFIDSFNSPAN